MKLKKKTKVEIREFFMDETSDDVILNIKIENYIKIKENKFY